ncbi:MAG: HvfA family oxazolone/thioamide-modified RiPP metallophore [Thiobacillus sp.]
MSKKTLIAAAAGSAFVASMAAAPITAAAENPFALSALSSGYQVASSHGAKPMEGKCGEGKCGGMKAGEGRCGMSMMDANKDGKISKEEFTKHHEAMFATMDANKDGSISKDEMGKMMGGKYGEGKCGAKK